MNSQKYLDNNRYKNIINNKKNYVITLGIIIGIIVIVLIYFIYKNYKNYKNNTPYLIEGTRGGNRPYMIPANMILDSRDSQYGIEMSYAFWIYVKDNNFNDKNKFKHIFHKGSNDYRGDLGNYPLLQSPGVWLSSNDNMLVIQFNTYNNIIENTNIGNIPLNKWVHISIVLIGKSVDVYVNCNLKKRVKLSGVPKLNQGDLYICQWGGFEGYLSKLRYYNYALKPFELDQICDNSNSPSTIAPEELLNNSNNYLAPNYWLSTGYPKAVGVPTYLP